MLLSYFPEPPAFRETTLAVETDAPFIERGNTGQDTMKPFFPGPSKKIFKHCRAYSFSGTVGSDEIGDLSSSRQCGHRGIGSEHPETHDGFAFIFCNGCRVSGCRLCLLYTSPSPRDGLLSRMPSSA